MRADCSVTGMGRAAPYSSPSALPQRFHLHLFNASHTAGSSMDHTCTSGLVRLWDADYSVDLFNFVTGLFNLVAGYYFMERTAFCTGTKCTCIKRATLKVKRMTRTVHTTSLTSSTSSSTSTSVELGVYCTCNCSARVNHCNCGKLLGYLHFYDASYTARSSKT